MMGNGDVMNYEFLIILISSLVATQIPSARSGIKEFSKYLLKYVCFLIIGIIAFSVCQWLRLKSNPAGVFKSFGLAFIKNYWISLIAVPVVVELLDAKKVAGWLSGIIIALGVLFLCFAPYFIPINLPSTSKLDLDGMIYTRKFYDVQNFRQYVVNGYIPHLEKGYNSEEKTDNPPTKDVEKMTFKEAVDAMLYYNNRDRYKAKECMYHAYGLYIVGQDNGVDDDIGMMYWYKGSYEDSGEDYYTAGETFARAGNTYNAVVSFMPAYDHGYCDSDLPVEYLLKSIREGTNIENCVDYFLELFNAEGTKMPHFDEFIVLLPNNLRVQMVGLNAHEITGEDMKVVKSFQSDGQYKNCPKLMIAEGYYNVANGMWYNTPTKELQEILETHEEFFCPEDKINLGWLFFLKGEVDMAMTVIDGLSYTEADLLKTAIYLQGTDVRNIKDVYYDLAFDIEFKSWYDDSSILKYDLLKAHLANAIGYRTESDDINDAYVSGNYKQVLDLCNKSIERGHDNTSILILKADALIHMIENDEDELYEETEKTIKQVTDTLGTDYMNAMSRLRNLYMMMPDRETEFSDVDKILRLLKPEGQMATS